MGDRISCPGTSPTQQVRESGGRYTSEVWGGRPGGRVRFTAGELKDLAGTVVSHAANQRVLVALEVAGDLLVEIDADCVAPLD